MCGFYCVISKDRINLEDSKQSLNLIKHRGPDSQNKDRGVQRRRGDCCLPGCHQERKT